MMRALVTGSAQGIGRAIADTLVSRGYGVVGADIQIQEGAGFEVLELDVSDPGSCRRAVAELGHVDVLVNNAGVLVEKSAESISDEEFDLTVAAFGCCLGRHEGTKMGTDCKYLKRWCPDRGDFPVFCLCRFKSGLAGSDKELCTKSWTIRSYH